VILQIGCKSVSIQEDKAHSITFRVKKFEGTGDELSVTPHTIAPYWLARWNYNQGIVGVNPTRMIQYALDSDAGVWLELNIKLVGYIK